MATQIFDAAMSFGCSYFVAAASPGPNFIIVSRAGLAGSRAASVRTAIGVVLGASVLTIFVVSCAQWLPQDGRVFAFTECVFVALLLWWSVQAIGRALSHATEEAEPPHADHPYLRRGFFTAVSNPFTATFLATAVDRDLSIGGAVGVVFAIASVWFGSVSILCGQPRMHALYRLWKPKFEFLFGFIFLFIATSKMMHISFGG